MDLWRIGLALASIVMLSVPAGAQRAVQSPLLVKVTREKSDSGRNTEYDSGYSSSRTYNRSVAIKIAARNMTTNTVNLKIQALFVAEALSSGSSDGIYCKKEVTDSLGPRDGKEFVTESDPLGSSVYKSSYGYSYKSGSKFKGYIVRIFADGSLVEVNGSTPSLQKVGWDERAVLKMLGEESPGGETPAGRKEPSIF